MTSDVRFGVGSINNLCMTGSFVDAAESDVWQTMNDEEFRFDDINDVKLSFSFSGLIEI